MLKLRLPGPAMGVAMFALFIALGGAGVAATNDFLPKNSVGTQQMQNNSVTRAKIAHQTITNVLIKPGSLMASSFAAGQIPAGPKGDAGATGPQGAKVAKGDTGATGPKGPAGVMGTMGVASGTAYAIVGGNAYVKVTVPDGKQATGATAAWDDPGNALLGYISVWPHRTLAGHVDYYEAKGHNGTANRHHFDLYVPYG